MDRKEFLSQMGLGSASLLFLGCMGGCSKADTSVPSAPVNVDFTLDLSASANATLNINGGYLYKSGIIVARTTSGTFLAVSQACTHEGVTVQYRSASNTFYCSSHGAVFSSAGSVVSGPANRPLTQYKTELSGSVLRVYS